MSQVAFALSFGADGISGSERLLIESKLSDFLNTFPRHLPRPLLVYTGGSLERQEDLSAISSPSNPLTAVEGFNSNPEVEDTSPSSTSVAHGGSNRGQAISSPIVDDEVSLSKGDFLGATTMPVVISRDPLVPHAALQALLTSRLWLRVNLVLAALFFTVQWAVLIPYFSDSTKSALLIIDGVLGIVSFGSFCATYNRDIFVLVLKSFEFWYLTGTFLILLWVGALPYMQSFGASRSSCIFTMLCVSFLFPCFAFAVDAAPFPKIVKLLVTIFTAGFFAGCYSIIKFGRSIWTDALADALDANLDFGYSHESVATIWLASCATLIIFFVKFALNSYLSGGDFIMLKASMGRSQTRTSDPR